MADASAIVNALIQDGEAQRVLARTDVAVPHAADTEVTAGLRRLVARGQMTGDEGRQALLTWARYACRRYPITGVLPRIWELRDNVSAHDAAYVALAETLECDLLTADMRLVQATGPQCGFAVVRD